MPFLPKASTTAISWFSRLIFSLPFPPCSIRRQELELDQAADGCAASDETVEAEIQARIARSLGLDASSGTEWPTVGQAVPEAEDKEEREPEGGAFDFRLFRTPGPAARVVLPSDEATGEGEGGIVARRRSSYYLVAELDELQRQQYASAAVSGDEVVARSRSPWWGLRLPWKLIQATATNRATREKMPRGEADPHSRVPDGTLSRRRRPGKKRRVASRRRARASREEEATRARQKAEKELHLKDKRKRLNRSKKLRRRAKDKEAKAVRDEAALPMG